MSGHHHEAGWKLSPVSELSVCMQGLSCEDSSLTPRRHLDLTPEMSSPDSGQPPGQHTPTGSCTRSSNREGTSPRQTMNRPGSQFCCLREENTGDEDAESDKENSSMRQRIRVRLFSSSSPEDQLQSERRKKGQPHSLPAEGEQETLESEKLILFQRLRSSKNPAHTPISITAVTDRRLIGDFSKHHILPVEKVNHQDLHCVSAETVASLIRGQFSAMVEDFLIIDCRYPYEYQGGHIKGAVNLYTESQIHQAFLHVLSTTQVSPIVCPAPGETPVPDMQSSMRAAEAAKADTGGVSSPRKLIVFHCEFSSERGPRLCQCLRQLDRAANVHTYPYLLYPELYLLQSGYKHFYSYCPELCQPNGYVPMHHRNFKEQFRQFSRKRYQHRLRRPIRMHQRTSCC